MTADQRPPALGKALGQRTDLLGALGRVENALAAPTLRPGWLQNVRSELTALREAFEHHLTVTEGEEGLFEDVIQTAPRLQHEVEVLRREHDEIEHAIEDALDPGRPVSEIRETAMGVLAAIVRHRQRGADLLYEAYDVDVSVGD